MDAAARKDDLNARKAEIYETLAAVNRSFEQLIAAVYRLEARLGLGEDYAFHQEIVASDMWARINTHVLARLTERELEDKNHFRRMRANLEKRKKST